MTIPDFQTLMRPILGYLADGQSRSTKAVVKAMCDEFGLTDAQAAEVLNSGRRRIDDKVNWSLTHMYQAGLLTRPARAHVQLSPAGARVLAAHPDQVDMRTLSGIPAYRDFRTRSKEKKSSGLPVEIALETVNGTTSPQDLIDAAVAENRAAMEGELLQKALSLSPTGFEDLVIRLLSAMGYGQAGSAERTSASGDAGIDGIISQDPLGLDRIYVQAKRYAPDHSIDRPKIHEFAGALLGKQGDRGVYITTSSFTRGARDEADRINARIELIDGGQLANLLLRYRVGVQVEQTVSLFRLDEDFFDDL